MGKMARRSYLNPNLELGQESGIILANEKTKLVASEAR